MKKANVFLKKKTIFFTSSYFSIIVSIVIIIMLYCASGSEIKPIISNILNILVYLSIFVPTIAYGIFWYFLNKKSQPKIPNTDPIKWKNKFSLSIGIDLGLTIFIVSISNLFSIFLIFLPFYAEWVDGEVKLWIGLAISIATMIINTWFAYFLILSGQVKLNGYIAFTPPLIIAFIYLFILAMFTANFPQRLLYPLGFIELPNNSSWYLLYNNFRQSNDSKEVNGINQFDLKKLKKNFACSAEEADKKTKKCGTEADERPNALYGYMAWNFGDIKIFCPEQVKFDNAEKNKEIDNKEMAKQCLVINSQNLQGLDSQYISYQWK
ncbi:hypothetical protein [Neisseria zalophi]|nr:hypothetical protein [Neisseria zalophi]